MFGDIHLCQFPFTSGAVSKMRPVLVLFDLQADVIVCRITSAQPRGAADVVLHDWHAAGLLTTSVARLDRLVTAERTVFIRQLGALSSADVGAVRIAWNRTMRL